MTESTHLSQLPVDLQQQSLRVQLLCCVSILKAKTSAVRLLSWVRPVDDMQGQQNIHLGAMVASLTPHLLHFLLDLRMHHCKLGCILHLSCAEATHVTGCKAQCLRANAADGPGPGCNTTPKVAH